jgi:uncharacterized protein
MRAVDTNVLVFAEITSSANHSKAQNVLRQLAEGPEPWAIPWPCVYEFLRIVTHPRVYHPPLTLNLALDDLGLILASPSVHLLSETHRHFEIATRILRGGSAIGNLAHDAHIAALCIEHGVRDIITGDRDFHRFPELNVVNPFA